MAADAPRPRSHLRVSSGSRRGKGSCALRGRKSPPLTRKWWRDGGGARRRRAALPPWHGRDSVLVPIATRIPPP